MRVFLVGLALAGLALAAIPGASACCHVYDDGQQEPGPCQVSWDGDAIRFWWVTYTVSCSAAGQTVERTVGPFRDCAVC